MNEKGKLLTRDFAFIFMSNLILFFGFEMTSTIVPMFIVDIGGSSESAGVATMVFTVTALFTRAMSGMALDRLGRRRVFIVGMIGMVVFSYLYGIVAAVMIVMVIRVMHGFFWGITSTSANTVASDVIPKERFGEGMGFYSLSNSIAMALGPAVGLMILDAGGYMNLFTFAAGSILVAMMFFLGMRNVKTAAQLREEQATADRPEAGGFIEKSAVIPGITMLMVCMTYGALVTFLALYGKELGYSNPGIFFMVYALSLLVSRPVAGRLTDAKGFTVVVIPGLMLTIIGLLILGLGQGIAMFLLAAVFYGMGFGAVQAALMTMAVVSAPPGRVGRANATFMMGFDAGIGAGSVAAGFIAGALGYGRMFAVSSLFVASALLFYLIFGRKRTR